MPVATVVLLAGFVSVKFAPAKSRPLTATALPLSVMLSNVEPASIAPLPVRGSLDTGSRSG